MEENRKMPGQALTDEALEHAAGGEGSKIISLRLRCSVCGHTMNVDKTVKASEDLSVFTEECPDCNTHTMKVLL